MSTVEAWCAPSVRNAVLELVVINTQQMQTRPKSVASMETGTRTSIGRRTAAVENKRSPTRTEGLYLGSASRQVIHSAALKPVTADAECTYAPVPKYIFDGVRTYARET